MSQGLTFQHLDNAIGSTSGSTAGTMYNSSTYDAQLGAYNGGTLQEVTVKPKTTTNNTATFWTSLFGNFDKLGLGISDIITSAKGGTVVRPINNERGGNDPKPKTSDNTTLYIILGVVVIGIAAYLLLPKKA